MRAEKGLCCRGRYPADKIEEHELYMTHRVFDVVPEHPEEPHVARQMKPPAVHEHGREDRPIMRGGTDETGKPGRELNAATDRGGPEQLPWRQPKLAHRPRQRPLRARALD